MSFGKQLVASKRKMHRLVLGTLFLLIVEFFGLTPFIGAFSFLLMLITFCFAFWYGNKISEPLLETVGDVLEGALAGDAGSQPKIGFGKLLIESRQKMKQMIFWLVFLLGVELFALPHIVAKLFGLPNLMGPVTFGIMFITFCVGLWPGNKITEPLFESGSNLIERNLVNEIKES